MNEDELKKEIEEALAVEPTPQFLARVRRQIATEPRPVRRLPWMLWAAGLVTAAVLVGIVALLPRESSRLPRPTPAAVTLPPETRPEPTRPERSSTNTNPPAPHVAPKVADDATPQPSKVEVLIDPREAAAFRSFVEAVEKKKFDPSKLEQLFEAADRTRTSAIGPMPIADLDPIVIQPLNPAATERGGNL